jgi:hypothetical protein
MYSESEQSSIMSVNIGELNSVREKIENMPKFNQIEVLRLLNKHKNVTLNENKYGIHINLSDLPQDIVEELKIYINYVNAQEINLSQMELQKETFKNIYFTKDNKDIKTKNVVEEEELEQNE